MVAKTEKIENGKSKVPKVAGNDDLHVHVVRKERYAGGPPVAVMTHALTVPDNRARLAMACIERWGMIVGEPDGEDSAGRQKGRRATPSEIVKHACDCADEAYKQFTARGWLIATPSYDELVDAVKDQEDAND